MSGVVVDGAEPASVRFALLGPVRAVDATGRPLELGSRRRRALLAALLLHPGSLLPVDRLVDLLWTGPAPATAATMVHGAVAGLRRALGPAAALLVTQDGGYTLRIEPAQLDVTRFEALLDDGRQLLEPEPDLAARTLLEALSQWRGPALADLDEAFARDAAARLDELRLQCAELRIEAELALGRHRDVVAELEALVASTRCGNGSARS